MYKSSLSSSWAAQLSLKSPIWIKYILILALDLEKFGTSTHPQPEHVGIFDHIDIRRDSRPIFSIRDTSTFAMEHVWRKVSNLVCTWACNFFCIIV